MIDISEQIKILRKQNRTVKDICQIVGKSESTVRRYVRALGLQKNTAREDIDSAVVYDMYVNKGYTVVEIAKYFDCAHDTIEKRLLSQGIVINKVENIKRHFDRVYDEQWENIKRDLDNRMSRSAVCSKYHMRMSSLDRLMKRHDYGCAVNYVSKIEEKLCVCDNVGEKRYLESMKEYYTEYQIIPTVSGLADFMKLHRTTVFGAVKRYSLSELVQVNVQSGYVSRLEADLTKLGVSFEKNNRIILDGYELDFYIDELKLGIEVNPVGTHSVDIPVYGISNRYYHQNKALLAEKKGIGLLHLYDIDFVYEYRYKRLLRLIESRLCLKQKCGARECLVKMIDRHTAVEFLEMFHLQGGETTSSYRYGLYYKDELVSVLTVGKSRYTDDEYEIIRYCPKPDTIIVGGFQKLFKSLLRDIGSDCSFVSYMDLNKRFMSGNVYERNGFVNDKITQPDYCWVDKYGTRTLFRYQTTKQQLIRQGFSADISEIEIMRSRGFFRVFGAGSKRYKYRVKISEK